MKVKELLLMTDIYCVKNYGYKWTIHINIFFKGYFTKDEVLYREDAAAEYLSSIKNYNDFVETVKSLYGSFAIIIQKNNEVWGAVDQARSIPLYFSTDGSVVSDCAETIRKKLNIDISDVNIKDFTSLLYTQFTLLNNTVYSIIKQLNLGQTLFIDNHLVKYDYYYRHIAYINFMKKEKMMDSLEKVLSNTFDRIIKAINKRPVLLSLSGGYDSRLVACMLKEKGINDVTCYTYGSTDSYEVEIARKVAENLEYKLHCITYSEDDIKSIFISENDEYFDMTNTHDYVVYLQNYLAVKKLKEQNAIKSDSVVITGLCGDMPSGAYVLPREQLPDAVLTYENIANIYIEQLFDQFHVNKNILNELKNEIEADLKKCDIKLDNVQNYVTLKDCLETAGVHSRCFLQANRIHEYFGFEWLIPLWDKGYLDFWYSLSIEYRANQVAYEEYLINNLFTKYNIAVKKIKSVRSVNKNKKRIGKKIKKKVRYFLGGILTRASFISKIPIKRKIADPNNFGVSTILLYKNIYNKKIINYRKANFTHLLNIYMLEKRYGVSALNKVKQ